MALPKNITKEHLLKAIEKIEIDGIPNEADSQYYDVVYKGKKYPPKVIVSYANIFANDSELNRNTFAGGIGTPCFKLLEENGFEIQSAEFERIPNDLKTLTEEQKAQVNKLIDKIEEDEDVQNVYHNMDE